MLRRYRHLRFSRRWISWRHCWRHKVWKHYRRGPRHTGERCVKISAYSDKNCRRRSILKIPRTDRQKERQTDTSTDNKGHYSWRTNSLYRRVVGLYSLKVCNGSREATCWMYLTLWRPLLPYVYSWKPWGEAWFQRTTNRKLPMGIKWPRDRWVASRDPERSNMLRAQYLETAGDI